MYPSSHSLTSLTDRSGLLFGADYNPEQWPDRTWPEDIRLMQEAGINLVTVGVFSWALLEPREGARNFTWLDRILDLLHHGGIRVCLATPTASPPAWLGHDYPETLPVDADGSTLWYGSRNQFNPSSAKYRQAAAAITESLARRYAGHPAVAMWHVGNELGQVSYDDETAAAFRDWLTRRYSTLAGLNSAWGTSFWSQAYGSWAEVLPPRTAPYLVNPSQKLDFQRFTSDQLLSLYCAERDIIRRYDTTRPVTTNLMGFFRGADYFSFAKETDVVANDWYTDPADPHSHRFGSLTHDLCRGLSGGRPWLLIESATSGVNWRAHNVPKQPGELRIDALSAVARGADGVCFFQFRQSRFGAERFHSAVVPLAGGHTRVFREVAALGKHLQALRQLAGSPAPPGSRSSSTGTAGGPRNHRTPPPAGCRSWTSSRGTTRRCTEAAWPLKWSIPPLTWAGSTWSWPRACSSSPRKTRTRWTSTSGVADTWWWGPSVPWRTATATLLPAASRGCSRPCWASTARNGYRSLRR